MPETLTHIDKTELKITDRHRIIEAGAREGHNNWLIEKLQNNFNFSFTRDNAKKLHPALLPFDLMLDLANDNFISEQLNAISSSLTERVFKSTSLLNIIERMLLLAKNRMRVLSETAEDSTRLITQVLEQFIEYLHRFRSKIYAATDPKSVEDLYLEITKWLSEISTKWINANNSWGENAFDLIKFLSTAGSPLTVEGISDLAFESRNDFLKLKELLVASKVSESKDLLFNNKFLLSLAVIAHHNWRKSNFPHINTPLGLDQIDFASVEGSYARVQESIADWPDELTDSRDTDFREARHKDPSQSSLQTFLLMLALAERYPSKLTYYCQEINYDLNPVTYNLVTSISSSY